MDSRSFIRKTADISIAILREIAYFVSVRRNKSITEEQFKELRKSAEPSVIVPSYDVCDSSEQKKWKNPSDGLHVLIHGLNGHPSIWDNHLKSLQDHSPTIDTFAPFVPFKGQSEIEDSANPILAKIRTYIELNPTKPVILSGVSNGGRIAHYIEQKLRVEFPKVPILVTTIASPLYGTMAPTQSSFAKNKFKKYHPAIQRSLAFGGEDSKKLLAHLNEPLKGVERKYIFFGSRNDWHVTHVGTTIPKVIHASEQHLVQGYMHSGIVKGVMQQHLTKAAVWMRDLEAVRD